MGVEFSMSALTHTQAVQRLYKASLKLARDWAVDVQLWRPMALTIRERFEANRHVVDPKKVDKLLEATRAELHKKRHPDPYRTAPGPEGSKWERNVPPPPHVVHGYGDFFDPHH